jgi:hypothetical protein
MSKSRPSYHNDSLATRPGFGPALAVHLAWIALPRPIKHLGRKSVACGYGIPDSDVTGVVAYDALDA